MNSIFVLRCLFKKYRNKYNSRFYIYIYEKHCLKGFHFWKNLINPRKVLNLGDSINWNNEVLIIVKDYCFSFFFLSKHVTIWATIFIQIRYYYFDYYFLFSLYATIFMPLVSISTALVFNAHWNMRYSNSFKKVIKLHVFVLFRG